MVETKLHRPGLHVIGCLHTSDIFDDDRLMDLIECFILRFGSTSIHGNLRGPPLPNDTPPPRNEVFLLCKVLLLTIIVPKNHSPIHKPTTNHSIGVRFRSWGSLGNYRMRVPGNTWSKISMKKHRASKVRL